jgi:DNA-binding NarL/FixJ family response regulator
MIRILISDENYISRSGLFTILSSQPDFEVVGINTDTLLLLKDVKHLVPDIVIVDIHARVANAVESIRNCCENSQSRVLLLVDEANDPLIIQYLRAGAQGCILKCLGEKHLIQSIRDISNDYSPISPNVAYQLLQYLRNLKDDTIPTQEASSELSSRELCVLRLLSEGLPNKLIGIQLGISERTVEAHVRNILRKINATSRTHAAYIATQKGWLSIKN